VEMPAQNVEEGALISQQANTNDIGHINAGAAVHGSLAGENPRRNDGTSARVSAGPLLLGYARVSKADQRLNRQVEALRQAGCNRVFEDHGISGMKVSRPGLDELLTFARPGDAIVILDLDRLGRSTRHLLALIDDLRDRGIGLKILNLGVDTNTPAGQLVLTVMASIAARWSARTWWTGYAQGWNLRSGMAEWVVARRRFLPNAEKKWFE
jgi:hypothetical protein